MGKRGRQSEVAPREAWQNPDAEEFLERVFQLRVCLAHSSINNSPNFSDASAHQNIMTKRNSAGNDETAADSDTDDANSHPAQSTESSADDVDGDELIKAVNAMSPEEFRSRYIAADRLHYTFKSGAGERKVTLDFKASSDLSEDELSSCFSLIETTSRADYEPSSFGWHPKRKRREMLEEEMRYLLVMEPATIQSETTPPNGKTSNSLAGFLSFMMTHDSMPSMPVLYIYEIHLDERLRRSALGSHLMALAESIAVKVGVEKVMLTCFLSNEKALHFYRGRNYEKDVCSPDDRRTRKKVVKVDYAILSKKVTDVASRGRESETGR